LYFRFSTTIFVSPSESFFLDLEKAGAYATISGKLNNKDNTTSWGPSIEMTPDCLPGISYLIRLLIM